MPGRTVMPQDDKWEFAIQDIWTELDALEVTEFGPAPVTIEEWKAVRKDVEEYLVVLHNKPGSKSRWKNMKRAVTWLYELTGPEPDERRYAADGAAYTYEEFKEYYKSKNQAWEAWLKASSSIILDKPQEEQKEEQAPQADEFAENVEGRRDTDGTLYSYEEFEKQYGDLAPRYWDAAGRRARLEGVEKRIDPADGMAYTYEEFKEEYGPILAKRHWENAEIAE
eukprot:TRINITY_DN31813_c0_g1_i1.p1 TRINITY_DN31813_c0_g1~~TRINITY_DN31813_c0_g1_i1.p1  ORF type:complete len:240 (+),score=47.64 TRINITY_DN31813_c0_g1_i1:49-720(+)